jgi:hypothetical protein
MKEYRGVDAYIHAFLISAIVGADQLHVPVTLSWRKVPPIPNG